jgi:Ca-activated chloride channel family protein
MEQWLRRIPDDPGGLLRQKFLREHQRNTYDEENNRSPW